MPRSKGQRVKVNSTDIITSVAKYSELTKDQTNQVIHNFALLLREVMLSETCPENVAITFANLGKFVLKKKDGLKAGSVVKAPLDFGKTRDENGKILFTERVLEEDDPDYQRIFFEVSPKLRREIKEMSIKRLNKKKGSDE